MGLHLQGGLCNKLRCLMSACDIALNEKCRIIEPYFGWKQKILFSDIYDLDYFNQKMFEVSGEEEIMLSRRKWRVRKSKYSSVENIIDLWKYSENKVAEQRIEGQVSLKDYDLKVLQALKLKEEFQEIVRNEIEKEISTAIQIRTESDWWNCTRDYNGKDGEKFYVALEEIITMLERFKPGENIFFTSGENHQKIIEKMEKAGFKPDYFFLPHLEYEQNAAINFEICCTAKKFIGLSRSSYSNLICLKRAALMKNNNSFIYNYNNKILKRVDKGLQYQAKLSVSEKTSIFN